MSEFQKSLIGASIMQHDSQAPAILEAGITRNHFTGEARIAWASIECMIADGKPLNLLTLCEEAKGRIDARFVEKCLDASLSAAFTDYNIEQVKKETLLRQAKDAVEECRKQLSIATLDDAETILTDCQTRMLQIVNAAPNKTVPLHDHISNFVRQCEKGEAGVIPWPLESIANQYGKLLEEFIIIHALPSIGKTALVIQWITHLHGNGFKTAFASLESSARAIAPRFLSHVGQIDTLRMKRGYVPPQTRQKAEKAVQKVSELGIVIKDGHMTDSQLAAWCRIQKQAGAQIIFIDNLRHIDSSRTFQDETRKFMEMSLAVKRIRDQLRIPIVLLHHSNENGAVGWSRDIVKDADIILSLEKDGGLGAGVDKINFTFQKHRDGGTCTIPFVFNKPFQTFDTTL